MWTHTVSLVILISERLLKELSALQETNFLIQTEVFYASQDADVTPDDEGGYFTWNDEDFRKLLDDEEYKVLAPYFSMTGA